MVDRDFRDIRAGLTRIGLLLRLEIQLKCVYIVNATLNPAKGFPYFNTDQLAQYYACISNAMCMLVSVVGMYEYASASASKETIMDMDTHTHTDASTHIDIDIDADTHNDAYRCNIAELLTLPYNKANIMPLISSISLCEVSIDRLGQALWETDPAGGAGRLIPVPRHLPLGLLSNDNIIKTYANNMNSILDGLNLEVVRLVNWLAVTEATVNDSLQHYPSNEFYEPVRTGIGGSVSVCGAGDAVLPLDWQSKSNYQQYMVLLRTLSSCYITADFSNITTFIDQFNINVNVTAGAGVGANKCVHISKQWGGKLMECYRTILVAAQDCDCHIDMGMGIPSGSATNINTNTTHPYSNTPNAPWTLDENLLNQWKRAVSMLYQNKIKHIFASLSSSYSASATDRIYVVDEHIWSLLHSGTGLVAGIGTELELCTHEKQALYPLNEPERKPEPEPNLHLQDCHVLNPSTSPNPRSSPVVNITSTGEHSHVSDLSNLSSLSDLSNEIRHETAKSLAFQKFMLNQLVR